jgi:hypothetical protein
MEMFTQHLLLHAVLTKSVDLENADYAILPLHLLTYMPLFRIFDHREVNFVPKDSTATNYTDHARAYIINL